MAVSQVRMIKKQQEQGYLLITAAILIVIFGFLAATVAYMSVTESRSSTEEIQSSRAFYIAESGLEAAIYKLLNPDVKNRAPCLVTKKSIFTDEPFGYGKFTVDAVLHDVTSPTELAAEVKEADTMIPVNTITGYLPLGRILINQEEIDYTSVSTDPLACGGHPACFLNAIRGSGETKPSDHDAGTKVGQYQCEIESTGEVQDASAVTVKRVLNELVQMQKGWAVGAFKSTEELIYRWGADNKWTKESIPINGSIIFRDVSAQSFADIWAVGSSGIIMHFDGNTWNLSQDVGSADLYGVYSINKNDVWAVDFNGGIYHYLETGGPWKKIPQTIKIQYKTTTKNAQLTSVSCSSKKDCWTTGYNTFPTNINIAKIYHYDGNDKQTWTEATIDPYIDGYIFNKIYCDNSKICWAIGANRSDQNKGLIYRYNQKENKWIRFALIYWDGSQWKSFKELYGVYCTSSDNCWFVGNSGWFYHFNGEVFDKTRRVGISAIQTVFCYHDNDCWAAGEGGRFYHYDGLSWVQNWQAPEKQIIHSIYLVGSKVHPESTWREIFN